VEEVLVGLSGVVADQHNKTNILEQQMLQDTETMGAKQQGPLGQAEEVQEVRVKTIPTVKRVLMVDLVFKIILEQVQIYIMLVEEVPALITTIVLPGVQEV
tara:strand:- start:178 stop:480 length:303 start_codon:yes stop_codon:yes gene_type:complete